MSRDVAILPRKVDWMLTDRAEDLRAIMTDNATFINFPPIGSSTSLITVYGEGKVNIQRTIRSVMQLVGTNNYTAIPETNGEHRHANSTWLHCGCCPRNSMFFCLNRLSTLLNCHMSLRTSPTFLVRRLCTRQCVLKCMDWNTKFATLLPWSWNLMR